MPWQLIGLLLALSLTASAAIWPPSIDPYQRQAVAAPDVSTPAGLWQEYGFVEGEIATYTNGAKQLTATAWRFQESTGPMAVFFWLAPAGGTPLSPLKHALAAKNVTLAAIGNYLVRFEGTYRPSANEIEFWVEHFPGYRNRSLPALPTYLPPGAASLRYIVGPKSLAYFFSELPVATAAFQFSSELILARYPTPAGELRVSVASYPNHHIARQQLPAYQQFAGTNARRSGALVIVALPQVPADAGPILDKIRYDAVVEFSETVPTQMPNVGGLLVAIFRLVGVLGVVGIGGGGLVALILLARTRAREKVPEMTRLNID